MADEVEIERLGAQGDGVAEGGTLFVPNTLPGERVRIVRHGVRAQVHEVLVRSPERVAPPCPHFGTCGGCALQHASDPFLAVWKRDMVAAALASRGIEAPAIRPTLTAPPARRRRITVAARRTKRGAVIGFHAAGSAEIVAVETCAVAEPALVAALGRLDEVVGLAASRVGEVRLTLTLTEGGVDVAVSQARPITGPAQALLAGVAARAGIARLAWNGEEVAVMRAPVVAMGRARVVPPPGGFLQPTAAGEAALVAAVREAVGGAARVADLYAGSGTFALPLAEGAEVHAVEADASALAALDAAWRSAAGLKRITGERRDLARRALLPAELKGFEAVVIDPPRAGARLQAEQLARAQLPRIASVSCNPATFARDARTLIDGGWRLEWVQPVDQFRWSPHVELV
ncbi:MAG TPA: class I SAM-dependent RNA methyltransferase, partial [Thermohalobaculum sp.]|nr:class I SAM-dependent RNA methyltransferase [Thermohalobaculum sp.]